MLLGSCHQHRKDPNGIQAQCPDPGSLVRCVGAGRRRPDRGRLHPRRARPRHAGRARVRLCGQPARRLGEVQLRAAHRGRRHRAAQPPHAPEPGPGPRARLQRQGEPPVRALGERRRDRGRHRGRLPGDRPHRHLRAPDHLGQGRAGRHGGHPQRGQAARRAARHLDRGLTAAGDRGRTRRSAMTQVIPNSTSASSDFTHVGASYAGLTNVELALGNGTFVSDVELPGMAHVAILRSPHAHARITSIDTSAAEALEGVLYVMTGEEARGVLASWDHFHQQLTYWESTQNPHPLRTFLAETLGLSENSIRVIQPRVGGAFGLKQPPFQEEPLVAYLSMKLRRPAKWIEGRDENFQATGHSRDVKLSYQVAFDDDGVVDAIDIRVIADVGAPTALLGWGQSFVTGYCLPTCYKIPNARIQLSVVVTNKCPWNAYRGFGKDSASFVMDRVMDRVARETGVDRTEVRLRNFILPDEFSYPQPTGAVLDSGNYHGTMRKVLEMVDYAGFPELQAEARAQGRRIGLGIGQKLTPEGCAMPGAVMISAYDGATVRVAPPGEVTVLTGTTSPGCCNETTMAQIAAEYLGCEFERVKVIQGDTDVCPYGLGNYSSRGTMYGGSATQKASVELR